MELPFELARFLRRCLSVAFLGTWKLRDLVAGIVGLLAPLLSKLIPEWESAMSELTWQLPLGFFAGVAAVRLFLAPYWIYREQEQEKKELQSKLEKAAERRIPDMEFDFRRALPQIIPSLRNPQIRFLVLETLTINNKDEQRRISVEVRLNLRLSENHWIRFDIENEPLPEWERLKGKAQVARVQHLGFPQNLDPCTAVAGYAAFRIETNYLSEIGPPLSQAKRLQFFLELRELQTGWRAERNIGGGSLLKECMEQPEG